MTQAAVFGDVEEGDRCEVMTHTHLQGTVMSSCWRSIRGSNKKPFVSVLMWIRKVRTTDSCFWSSGLFQKNTWLVKDYMTGGGLVPPTSYLVFLEKKTPSYDILCFIVPCCMYVQSTGNCGVTDSLLLITNWKQRNRTMTRTFRHVPGVAAVHPQWCDVRCSRRLSGAAAPTYALRLIYSFSSWGPTASGASKADWAVSLFHRGQFDMWGKEVWIIQIMTQDLGRNVSS